MVLVAALVVWSTEANLSADLGLPLVNQIASWALLTASMALVFSLPPSVHYYDAFTAVAVALAVPFVLLSISYYPSSLYRLFINSYFTFLWTLSPAKFT